MIRNRPAVIIVATLLLSACGGERASSQPSHMAELPRLEAMTKPIPGSAAEADISGTSTDEALADFLQRSGSDIRYDRVRKIEDGSEQRQVFVEVVGRTAEETDRLAAETFTDAGFSIKRGLTDGNGIRLQYRRSDVTPIDVLIRSASAGPKLDNPNATSSLYLKQLQ